MPAQARAYLCAAAAVLFWGTAASAFKISLRHVSTGMLLLIATVTSVVVLGFYIAVSGRWREFRGWRPADLRYSAALGVLNPFLYYVILFHAYDLLPAQEAQPLNFIWPLVLVLLSGVILGQRIGPLSIVALLVCFVGVLVIATRGDPAALRFDEPLGVSLALGSAVVWALYWLYSARDRRDPVNRLWMNFVLGLVPVGTWVLLFDTPRLPPPAGLAGGVYVGLFEMGITFVLWLHALRLSRTTAQVGALIYLTPFVSLVVIHFAVGERIIASTWIGLVLIVAGVVLQQYGDRRTAAAVK